MFWFGRSPSYYTAPPKTTPEFRMSISPSQPSLAVPFELHGAIQSEAWAQRVSDIARVGGQYSRPALEWVWIVLSIVLTLVVPLVLYQSINHYFAVTLHEGFTHQAKPRLVLFGIFVAVALVCFSPLVVWKFIGQITMNRMVTRWSASDRATSGLGAVPTIWKVSAPGILKTQSYLYITFPRNSTLSHFNNNTLLPSYFNVAPDEDGAYFYPYKREPGLPRMSVIGNVPLYLDAKRLSSQVPV
ncbi:hypothetical protein BDN72DRAFT_513902 [Pluteus cervinus]|uniref:Uncharacterized protein n=1 Tax=Pluteus cervinus TaxID=181527 RepID=A0ACD3BCJ0_9AGAR|nr:hypothetical protein BDN72DRAFT_513902 [Pluteus cervinus]